TDNEERIGPIRVTQAGLIAPKVMQRAIYFVFALTLVLSIYLVYKGGLPILLIGVISIISGIIYTAGPFPLGYIGIADLFVLIFFGPVAVAGTYYLQTLSFHYYTVIAGLAPGFLSVAILTVNNYRDLKNDRNAGKKTIVVRFGEKFGRIEYYSSILLAFLIPIILILLSKEHYLILLCFLLSPLIFKAFKIIRTKHDGKSLNQLLAFTGKILLLFSFLFSIGWIYS
ncbi:MAG: 1,4-dihydroxy-2-naphthoate octaprenyltransferase, partial [Calditrichia bacterium]|nr:1,4-dihydroxy-2-naphthoate octaprenyltransferase [Calditrichia bacterium]